MIRDVIQTKREGKKIPDYLLPRANDIIKFFSDYLQKPLSYTLDLLLRGSAQQLDFVEHLGKPWNEDCRERFHTVREHYAEKKDILVLVGSGHLPAFLE